MHSNTSQEHIQKKGVFVYLLITFGIAWLDWLLAWLLTAGSATSVSFTLLSLPAAFTPALATVVVRRWVTHEGFHDAGLQPHLKKQWHYYIVAYLWPIPVVGTLLLLDLAFGVAQPDFSLQRGLHFLQPGWHLPSLIIWLLHFGLPLITLFLIWGEEFGWQGYLLPIVDDHSVVRQGLRFMLEQREDILVLEECVDGQQAIASALTHLPEVMLLDLLMPNTDGVTAIREIKRLVPSVQIVVLTSSYEDEHIFQAMRAGALSYLLKDSSPFELVEAVRRAARGESTLHPKVATRLLQELSQQKQTPLNDLTSREVEVLTRIARGRSNSEIATELVISEPTVRTHVGNILTKLHLADRTQAAIYALQQRLVPLDDALKKL